MLQAASSAFVRRSSLLLALLFPMAGAFAKTAIIYQHHIIIIPVKILCIPCPTFYTPGISMKIEDQAMWLVNGEMKPVYPNTRLYIKKQFFEGSVIFVNEILFQFFRLKDKSFLHQVNDYH